MLIKDVDIVDYIGRRKGNVLLEDGIIKDLNYSGNLSNIEVIDGTGLTLMPSFIDMHTHLRDPGFTYKEDMESGMKAALKGGFTHICAMANTDPIMDNASLIKDNLEKSKTLNLCYLIQLSSITKSFESKFVDIGSILPFTRVFSNDGKTILSEDIMEKALKLSSEHNFLLCTHSEPEVEIIERDLNILSKVGGNLHICHVSEKKSIDLIREAKNNGLAFTSEVTPHHLFKSGLDYKVSPPFGTEEDRMALVEAVKEDIIEICATDHAPHSKEDKEKGSPGINNIEAAFSMYYKAFYDNHISLPRLSQMLSYSPAKRLGLNTGEIKIGAEGSLVLIDENYEGRLNTNNFVSKTSNNPFHGEIIRGSIIMTILRGEVKYDNR